MHLHNLTKTLFANYDPSLRPVLNDSATLNVQIQFHLSQILEIVNKTVS